MRRKAERQAPTAASAGASPAPRPRRHGRRGRGPGPGRSRAGRRRGRWRTRSPAPGRRSRRAGAGQQCLAGVEQAAVGRGEVGLRDGAYRVQRTVEVGEGHGGRGPVPGALLQTHPGLGDDAERAFRAEEQAVGRRSGAGCGQPPGRAGSRGRDHAQGLDEVVDAGAAGGVVAAGPGGQPAAEGGELEALREVAQGEAVGPQLRLQYGAERAGLDAGRTAGGVDLQDPVHGGEVERQHGAVGVAAVLDAADDRGAAAEGDDGHVLLAGPVQQVGHLPVVGRAGDQVGDPAGPAAQRPDDVAVGLAHRVRGARLGVGGDQVRQGRRRCRAGPGDGQVGDPGDRQWAGQGARQQRSQRGALRVAGVGVGVAPAPPGPWAGGAGDGRGDRHECAPSGVRVTYPTENYPRVISGP